jgi:hypothetical protein
MRNTQLTCPHCGSSLNFGMEIVAGTPIECLICMRSFSAPALLAPPAAPEIEKSETPEPPPMESGIDEKVKAPEPQATPPAPETPKAKPTPPVGIVEKAKPASKPVPVAMPAPQAPVAEMPSPPPQTPRVRQPASNGNLGILLVAGAAICVLFFLVGGIGVVIWKFAVSPNRPTGASGDLVLNGTKASDPFKPDTKSSVKNPGDEGGPPTPIEEDEETRKLREAEKKLLQRQVKPVSDEIKFDPISSIKVAPPVPGLTQQKINAAIDKGVIYLKQAQNPNGTWSNGHPLGHAAIGGLTLLECGVAPTDAFVQRSAAFVRANASANKATYELSLAILFLDKLGDPRDRVLIQGMALRLLAGQLDSGGWTYHCPVLNTQEMYQLYSFLQSHQPKELQNPLGGAKPDFKNPVGPDGKNLNDPFHQLGDLILMKAIEGKGGTPSKDGKSVTLPKDMPPKTATGPAPKPKPIDPATLLPSLQKLPVVQNQGKVKTQVKVRGGDGDNSNTQFALLAIWTARRHDIPTDQALLAAYMRFHTSQCADGGWAYHPNPAGATPSMTCVGLLGEAMGHGVAPEVVALNPKSPKDLLAKPALEDEQIKKGLGKLSRHIGDPSTDEKRTSFPMENLYLLWSVERVAMLYDLKTINGKDWYGWGAQILVHNQDTQGAWPASSYHGQNPPLNTCFALLFLRRSNLVQDLTNNLRLHSAIRDPEK